MMEQLKRKSIWTTLLKWMGWKIIWPEQDPEKSIVCVAPHTSNCDFFIGLFYFLSLHRGQPNFLIKKEWFVFPFNIFFKALGGVPVDRKKAGTIVDAIVALFSTRKRLYLGITPEGSRGLREHWKTGFYRIADKAKVPIELAKIDYKRKEVGIFKMIVPTGDIERELQLIRSYYTADMARFPKQFAEVEKP